MLQNFIAIFRPKLFVNIIVLNASSFYYMATTHKVCNMNRSAPGFDVRPEDRVRGSINRHLLYGAMDLGRLSLAPAYGICYGVIILFIGVFFQYMTSMSIIMRDYKITGMLKY